MANSTLKQQSQIYLSKTLHFLCVIGLSLNCISIWGAAILIPIAYGLYTARKSKAESAISTTSRIAQIFFIASALITAAGAVYFSKEASDMSKTIARLESNIPHKDEFEQYKKLGDSEIISIYGISDGQSIIDMLNTYRQLVSSSISQSKEMRDISHLLGVSSIFYVSMVFLVEFGWRRHILNKINNGKRFYGMKFNRTAPKRGSSDIESFSPTVADELLKWTALREGGSISEDEFKSAKARLLRKYLITAAERHAR